MHGEKKDRGGVLKKPPPPNGIRVNEDVDSTESTDKQERSGKVCTSFQLTFQAEQ